MTTNEEFQAAIKKIVSCKATMNCGCEYDDMLADSLYYQCKSFIDAYKRRIDRELKRQNQAATNK